MADKNLHDIKIDELDSPKKTPLKNILTLLALLFIILVISVVITKLILNTDEGSKIDSNDSKIELTSTNDESKEENTSTASEATKETAVTIPVLNSKTPESNLSSVIKTPLSSTAPKEIKTYKTPKKNTESTNNTNSSNGTSSNNGKKTSTVKKDNTDKKSSSQPKKEHSVKRSSSQPKKEYISKKETSQNTATKNATNKKATYLGGQRKDVSNSYYIKVGTYRDVSTVINKVKKNNFNYSLVKVEDDKTLIRVLVGPFFSKNQANSQLAKVKANILPGAYVTKVK